MSLPPQVVSVSTHFYAAAAEHLSARWATPGPLWTVTNDRFLTHSWWLSELPSVRAYAVVGTPAAFRRRGIYIDRHDLTHDGTSTTPQPLFDRTEILRAFDSLADKLQRKNIVGQVHVVGGAAMLLAYDSGATTRGIDARYAPDGPMLEAVREIARENCWQTTWLNNQASSYVSRNPGQGSLVYDHPNLQVAATPAEHLLAMKTLAARGVRDRDDIQLLIERLAVATQTQVWTILDRFFPGEPVPERSRRLIEDLVPEPPERRHDAPLPKDVDSRDMKR
jgi:hypothetical protein